LSKILELGKIDDKYFTGKNSVIVIGFFDGVHLGHRKIIKACIDRAKKIKGTSTVLTFNEPPVNVIKNKMYKKLIIPYREKIKIIDSMGIDYIITANFSTGFLSMEPQDFCRNILVEKFHAVEIFTGEGFRFGFNARGNILFLKKFFRPLDVKINTIALIKVGNEVISSTNIRKYYTRGDIGKIKRLLGRNPQIEGSVIKGAGRGKKLGFPTANIDVCDIFIAPKDGVYLGTVGIKGRGGKPLPALVNIGDNPTFGDSKKLVETFIIDFKENIYKRKIRINFSRRLRDEIRFESKDKLVKQLKMDLEYARKYFQTYENES